MTKKNLTSSKKAAQRSFKAKDQPLTSSPKNFRMFALLIAATVIVIGAIWLLTSVLFSEDAAAPTAPKDLAPAPSSSSEPSEAPTAPATDGKNGKRPTPDATSGNVPSGTTDANKALVLEKAVAILTEAQEVGASGNSYQELLFALQNGDFSLLTEDFKQSFRFSDYLATDELRSASYISVIHLSTLVGAAAAAQELESIQPLNSSAQDSVFVDMEAGQAFVPLTVFLGQDASFSMEFIYVNGEWQLTPYSLIDSIQAAERAAASVASSSE